MRAMKSGWWTGILLYFLACSVEVFAQAGALKHVLDHTHVAQLRSWSEEWAAKAQLKKAVAVRMALQRGWPIRLTDRKSGKEVELIKLAPWGEPLYAETSNRIAARTIGTWRLRPGGDLGLSLKGTGIPIGIWDGGAVRGTHQELLGRVTQVDGVTTLSAHGTHVAGTLMATGVDTNARGMAYEALLLAHDWNSDDAEMASAASSGLLVSNHSYGWLAGWSSGTSTNGTSNFWNGWEPISPIEDYKFGYYDDQAATWDQIASAAPYYLICKSAGNDRGETRPSGTSHNVQDSVSPFNWRLSTSTRNADGNSSGFDCITGAGLAKNVLTIGSVNALPNGYTSASAVTLASSSGNGPTDDGRIKPDVVAQGVGLYSSTSSSNNAYTTLSGTSMASPSAAGSLLLLQDLYQQRKGKYMRAASLKGLAIHTSDEAGTNPGPDYRFGWGLLNIGKAAKLLQEDGQTQHLLEDSLIKYQTKEYRFYSDGSTPVQLTLSWTDLAGIMPAYPDLLNNPSRMLIHDLDLRLVQESNNQQTFPWVLNPSNPSAAATRGDNIRDNVEQIVLSVPAAGWYKARVQHKNTLSNTQYFTLIASGLTYPGLPPTANFLIADNRPCVGQSVRLEALDSLIGTTYSWSFPGGNPATSNSRIVQVSYSQNGAWPIQLVAMRNGQTDTLTRTIQVGGGLPPLLENFEQSPHSLEIQNPDAGSLTWQADSTSWSRNGTRSMRMPFFMYNQRGQKDYLVFPLLNLSGQAGAKLTFDHAYTRYPTELSDTLMVQVTVGCNNQWATVASFSEGGNGSFATFGNGFSSNTSFIPSTYNDWCGSTGFSTCKQVNLNAFAGQAAVKVRFTTVNQYGNNLFIDNIKLTSFYNISTDLKDTICEGQFRVFNGDTLRNSGVYRDTLVNASGGDSIVVYQLQVKQKSFRTLNVSICEGQAYLFNGNSLINSGIYWDTLANFLGCDSLLQLQLQVKSVKRDSISASICFGKSYSFGNRTLTLAGWYSDTLTSFNGCDSIRVLRLQVKSNQLTNLQASICEGSRFNFGNRQLNSAGTYTDSLLGTNGCDSIVQLILNIKPKSNSNLSITLCSGQSYVFDNRILTQSGIYKDTVTASNGCDSIIQINLTILPPLGSSLSVVRCEGQLYWFNGQWLSQAGTYKDTLTASSGCDSILTLQLLLLPKSGNALMRSICLGDSLLFGGNWIKQAGFYRDTLINQLGCDSVVNLQISLLNPSTTQLSASFCSGKSFLFGGQWLQLPGVYRDTLIANNGCDSIIILQLQRLNSSLNSLSRTICSGQQFNFNGRILNTPGVYRDTLLNYLGCDSIVSLQLQVQPTIITNIQQGLCPGNHYWFNGNLIQQAGVYRDTMSGSFGCDSIIILTVNQLLPTSAQLSAKVCAPQAYWFGGRWLNSSGIYHDTIANASGCDSVITLNLTVQPEIRSVGSAVICSGKSIVFGFRVLTQSGIYHDTLQAVNGCDSIVRLDLTVLPASNQVIQAGLCPGGSYVLGNRILQQAGTYFDTLIAANGCDSVIRLELQVLNPVQTFQQRTLCQGQSLLFNGQLLTISGTYRDTLSGSNGCDSIVTLQLTVLNTQFVNISATVCPGASYFFHGVNLTQPGTYRDTLVASRGCDSIITLSLGLKQPSFTQIQDSICFGKTYSFGNQLLTQAGIYRDTLTASNGCDSIITLTLNMKTGVFTNQSIMLCFGDSVFINGAWRKTSQSIQLNYVASNSCDSIHTIQLLVRTQVLVNPIREICQGQIFNFNGRILSQSGTYRDTLLSINGCDSVVNLTLNVQPNPVQPTITRNSNTLVSSSISGNQWYQLGVGLIPGAINNSYTPNQPNGGQFWVVVTNGFGCVSLPSDTFAFIGTGSNRLDQVHNPSFYPNPTHGALRLIHQVEEGVPVSWALLDLHGRLIALLWKSTGRGIQEEKTVFLPELAQGTYLIQYETSDFRKVEKLVLLK